MATCLVVDVNGDGSFTAADAVIEVDYTGTFGTALFI